MQPVDALTVAYTKSPCDLEVMVYMSRLPPVPRRLPLRYIAMPLAVLTLILAVMHLMCIRAVRAIPTKSEYDYGSFGAHHPPLSDLH